MKFIRKDKLFLNNLILYLEIKLIILHFLKKALSKLNNNF